MSESGLREDYRRWVDWKSCFACIHMRSEQCDEGAGYTLQDEHGVCPIECEDDDMTNEFEPCSYEEFCKRRGEEGW